MSFINYYKQMKASFAVIYADFESLSRTMQDCKPPKDENFSLRAEKHEACGFAYTIVRSDCDTFGPVKYRGEDAVHVFFANILRKTEEQEQI